MALQEQVSTSFSLQIPLMMKLVINQTHIILVVVDSTYSSRTK